MQTRRLDSLSITTPELCHLTLTSSTHRKTYEVKEFMTLGRDDSCTLPIPDNSVSLRHARIEQKKTGYTIKDLRSRNGTWVNQVRVVEAELQHMDQIKMGESQFIFTHYNLEKPIQSKLTSKNARWGKQLEKLPVMSQTNHPVLILGASGTGKEVLAHAIHEHSKRANAPFISVNCSALTETLVESELFGHIKGSFTGAINDRKGAFEIARGGTLFLDEIGDLPINLQPKLLRALENLEIKPVGSERNIPIDVRIIAATNQSLQKHIEEGRFRQDLYFRLHVLQLNPPLLRERMEDFDELFHRFADPLRVRFTCDALSSIKKYSWPGNIRELKNVISRASALFPEQPITNEELPYLIDASEPDTQPVNQYPVLGYSRNVMREFERDLIVERLLANKGNQRRTAAELGLPKSTLHDRIKIYGINVKEIGSTGTSQID